jgi:hypothetical protein
MKKLILALLGAILVTLAASTAARACDSYDPGNPNTTFE